MRNKSFVFTIFLLTGLPFCNFALADGFSGAGGFSFYLVKPDLAPINQKLEAIGMPQFDGLMFLYGGQGLGHVSDRMRVGGMGFGGKMIVSDMKDGYAREVSFEMAWGGLLLEYIAFEGRGFEIYSGGTLGWGGVSVHLEKSAEPADWDEVWNNYQPVANTEDNLSSTFTHSFFMLQPRLGVRYFLLDWLAVSGSVDLPLLKLNSSDWKLNGNDVYNAPELDLIQPFFQFAILFGG